MTQNSHNQPVTVMFACRKNAGRSQIAAALLAAKTDDRVRVLSAGTTPANELHPQTYETLAEIGLEPLGGSPTQLTVDNVSESDWVITMGCGETCPIFPGTHYEDWDVADPANQPTDVVRQIREDIAQRVDQLIERLDISTPDRH
ncbi:low molecular weight phosphatase family protein [Arcanobacterium phocisimile]|uniref:Low molecular weight phosphatase family protein n=1 Tax=Arcanobacterium phocisimile TaxID=1302235 RepID=A0ABX7IHT0_9ACTO|nr:low molecular weight phosphatase family protein [Arcanobacterium phocisimile]QRV01670.1 low molecular weight phosphatase family protein [Arcanobacterium phocisimile]